MNRELARIQRGYLFAYYRRVGKEAVEVATSRWLRSFGSSGFVGLLTFALLIIAGNGLGSAVWGLVAFLAAWLLIAVWVLVTIPPRVEREMQLNEDTLQVLTQRRNVANELRNHMIQCRMSAREARAVAIEPQHRGMTPDTFHQRALLVLEDAGARLERLSQQTGQQASQRQHIQELADAVSAEKCDSFDAAIAQLEALADVLERQLSSGQYW